MSGFKKQYLNKGVERELTDFHNKSLEDTKPLYVSDTDYHKCNGYAIKALSETTFTSLYAGLTEGSDTGLDSETMLAGDVWIVPIYGFELATGSVFVYQHNQDNS